MVERAVEGGWGCISCASRIIYITHFITLNFVSLLHTNRHHVLLMFIFSLFVSPRLKHSILEGETSRKRINLGEGRQTQGPLLFAIRFLTADAPIEGSDSFCSHRERERKGENDYIF